MAGGAGCLGVPAVAVDPPLSCWVTFSKVLNLSVQK